MSFVPLQLNAGLSCTYSLDIIYSCHCCCYRYWLCKWNSVCMLTGEWVGWWGSCICILSSWACHLIESRINFQLVVVWHLILAVRILNKGKEQSMQIYNDFYLNEMNISSIDMLSTYKEFRRYIDVSRDANLYQVGDVLGITAFIKGRTSSQSYFDCCLRNSA